MLVFEVAFRVMGARLDPEEVSKLLGTQPTEAHKKGDARPTSSRTALAPYDEGLWCLSIAKSNDLQYAIHELTAKLTPRMASLEKLKQLGFRLDIMVGVFGAKGNAGFSLASEDQTALEKLHLPLEFDVYV